METQAEKRDQSASTQAFRAPPPLTVEQATMERMFQIITSLPDPDEALRRAGILRHQLRAVEMDDEVTAALDTRREALLSTPWRLEGGTKRNVDFLRESMDMHMDKLLRGCFSAVPYGYSVVEVVLENVGSSVVLAAAPEKPFEWFVPSADGINLRWKDPRAGFEGVPVDPRKFLLTSRNPTARNPYGEAMLSRVYWPWFFRQNGWKFWMRWLERFGNPLLLGKTTGDPQKLAENLARAVNGSAIAVGNTDDVKAVDTSGGAEHFESFDNVICRRIQKLILGQTLTTDASSGGSYAAARVADGVRTDRRNADIRMVSRTVQRLVNTLWVFNGFSGTPPRFVMADDTGLERERAERDAILVEKVGVRLTPAYISDRYDLDEGDFTLEARSPEPTAPALAAPHALRLSAGPQFTPVQQGIEDSIERLGELPEPIELDLIRQAVLASRDEEDLRRRLGMLLPQRDRRFQALLEKASFAAAVLGYVAADENKT